MKKILICMLFVTQYAIASTVKSSHPIYFTAGDVKPHQLVSFELPYKKMQPAALYDVFCQLVGFDIDSLKPIIYANITGGYLSLYQRETTFNGISMRYPFQEKLISKNNELIIHNVINNTDTTMKMNIYNFDDVATITASNCYVIIGKQNA